MRTGSSPVGDYFAAFARLGQDTRETDMLFDSPIYFVFLVPIVVAYWKLSHRQQNIFLLIASYFFYGWWDWRFLALMAASTTIDFLIAQKIATSPSQGNR